MLYGTCTTLQVSSSRFQLQADVFVGGIWILIVYLRGKSYQVAVVSKMQFLTRCKQKQTMLIDGICFLAVNLRGKSNQVAGSSATFGEKVTKLRGRGVYKYIHTYMHACMHTYTCTYIYIYIYIYIPGNAPHGGRNQWFLMQTARYERVCGWANRQTGKADRLTDKTSSEAK